MAEMIPDSLPEGFGEDVEVSENSPHPNKRERKRVHLLEAWAMCHENAEPPTELISMMSFDDKDVAIIAAGLSTLWAAVTNGEVGFLQYDDPKAMADQVKARAMETLKKLAPIAQPSHLPGGDNDE